MLPYSQTTFLGYEAKATESKCASFTTAGSSPAVLFTAKWLPRFLVGVCLLAVPSINSPEKLLTNFSSKRALKHTKQLFAASTWKQSEPIWKSRRHVRISERADCGTRRQVPTNAKVIQSLQGSIAGCDACCLKFGTY